MRFSTVWKQTFRRSEIYDILKAKTIFGIVRTRQPSKELCVTVRRKGEQRKELISCASRYLNK